MTRCWCASWSRSPPSCKCGPSSSEAGSAARAASPHSNLHDKLFSLLTARLSFLIQTSGHVETWRRVSRSVVLNVAGSQVVFRFTQPGGFSSGARLYNYHFFLFTFLLGLHQSVNPQPCMSILQVIWLPTRGDTACPGSPTLLLHFSSLHNCIIPLALASDK